MASVLQTRIEGFVLAGGASSRMGRPKSGLLLVGRTLLDRAAETMSVFADGQLSVLVGPELPDSLYNGPFVLVRDLPSPEKDKGSRAPIFGLRTALSVSSAEWIAVLAVDLPFVTVELFRLLATKASEDIDVVVPVQPDGSMQPLCAIYRRETVLPAVEAAIGGDDISLRGMIAKLNTYRIDPADLAGLSGSANFFVNVNTPDDLEAAADLAG